MVEIETDRVYAIYTRQNRRVQWRYAKYLGRWPSPREAIEEAKERISGEFEYLIEKIGGEWTETGTAIGNGPEEKQEIATNHTT